MYLFLIVWLMVERWMFMVSVIVCIFRVLRFLGFLSMKFFWNSMMVMVIFLIVFCRCSSVWMSYLVDLIFLCRKELVCLLFSAFLSVVW